MPDTSNQPRKWEGKLETDFNSKFGFGIWDSRSSDGHRNEGIFSSNILEFCRQYVSKVEDEAREEISDYIDKRLLAIAKIYEPNNDIDYKGLVLDIRDELLANLQHHE